MRCQPVRVTPSHSRRAQGVGNRLRTARASVVAIAFTATAALLVASLAAASARSHRGGVITISTLSDRADLITGGRVLVRVELPAGTRGRSVRITLDGRNVSGALAIRAGGAFEGLVTGLRVGRNVLEVLRRDGSGALYDHEPPDRWPAVLRTSDRAVVLPTRGHRLRVRSPDRILALLLLDRSFHVRAVEQSPAVPRGRHQRHPGRSPVLLAL